MTRSNASPKGHMTLTLLNPDGTPMLTVDNHNTVLENGRATLLTLLAGGMVAGGFRSVLGGENFKVESFKPGEDEAGAIALKGVKAPKIENRGNVLTITQTATANQEASVIGGGLVLTVSPQDNPDKKEEVLYNFAELPNKTPVKKEQPIQISFNLSME